MGRRASCGRAPPAGVLVLVKRERRSRQAIDAAKQDPRRSFLMLIKAARGVPG